MSGCNYDCIKLAADLSHIKRNVGLYAQGYRYCTTCKVYYMNELRCRCCSSLLRRRARYSDRMKQKYLINKNINKNNIKNILFDNTKISYVDMNKREFVTCPIDREFVTAGIDKGFVTAGYDRDF